MRELSDLYLPPYPRIRWWWSRRRKDLAWASFGREWQRVLWEQTRGAPVRIATIRSEEMP